MRENQPIVLAAHIIPGDRITSGAHAGTYVRGTRRHLEGMRLVSMTLTMSSGFEFVVESSELFQIAPKPGTVLVHAARVQVGALRHFDDDSDVSKPLAERIVTAVDHEEADVRIACDGGNWWTRYPHDPISGLVRLDAARGHYTKVLTPERVEEIAVQVIDGVRDADERGALRDVFRATVDKERA